jgi:signal transduction histidine kinase
MGNLLLPIRMRLDSLERMGLPDAARKDLEAIKTAAEYLRRLSQGLRQFSHDSDDMQIARENTTLSRWWPDTEPFIRNALSRTIRLDVSMPADMPTIAIAPHRLTQMIYNLSRNAADAMSGRASGQVQIVAEAIDDGQRAAISVIDNGPGMTDEVKRHCMEPFFTTKPVGEGTGLGLDTVYRIVQKHHGEVRVDSEPGRTSFQVRLPFATICT